MNIPRSRGKRLHIYLSEEVYEKAMARYRNLDAKIEQLLRAELAREEGADAAFGFGSPGISNKPISEIVQEETAARTAPGSIPEPADDGGGAFFELNPEAEPMPNQEQQQGPQRLNKRDRLPVFKARRRRR